MYWQRGFAIETSRIGNFLNAAPKINVDVKFVHADGVEPDVQPLCNRGCCEEGVCTDLPPDADLSEDECKNVAPDMIKWYATCNIKDSYDCHNGTKKPE